MFHLMSQHDENDDDMLLPVMLLILLLLMLLVVTTYMIYVVRQTLKNIFEILRSGCDFIVPQDGEEHYGHEDNGDQIDAEKDGIHASAHEFPGDVWFLFTVGSADWGSCLLPGPYSRIQGWYHAFLSVGPIVVRKSVLAVADSR